MNRPRPRHRFLLRAGIVAILMTLILAIALAGCSGSARRSPPFAPPLALDAPEIQTGHDAFAQNCDRCHPSGEAGLGPSINDKPLPAWLMRLQIRRGFGDMPAFDGRLDDKTIDAIAVYLKALRGQSNTGS